MIEQVNEVADTLLRHTMQVAAMPEEQHRFVWFYIAFVELGILLLLFPFIFRKNKQTTTGKRRMKNAMKGKGDFQNIINSSFHATELYNELKVKCHPERFAGDAGETEIAHRLFQEITKNKTNYNRLNELKEQARRQLNINV